MQVRRHIRLILVAAVMAVAVIVMSSGTASANYAGISDSFDENRGLPGAGLQRYQGHYMGGTRWVENQYDNAFTMHRSDMIYSNNQWVEGPFTNVEIYRNGNFLFRVPSWSFDPDPEFIPPGWYRQGGISHNYTVSISNTGTVKARGNMGFHLCDASGCAGGLWLYGEWYLW